MTLDRSSYDRLSAVDCTGELAFVQDGLTRFFDRSVPSGDAGVAARDISLGKVAEIARLNKVTNFLLKVFPRTSTLPASAEFLRALDTYRGRTASLNAFSLMDTLAIQNTLRSKNLDFVFLKGPVQQGLLYGDHFMKPAGDVDVLVSRSDFAKARDALRSIGYEVAEKSRSRWWVTFLGEQHLTRTTPRLSTVDLHQRLQQPGSPSPRDTDLFLQRKRLVEVAGTKTPFISAQDILLLACISVAKALFNREACAGYVCDIRAGLDDMADEGQRELLDHAGSQGLAGTLLLGARAADLLLGGAGGPLSDAARGICPGLRDNDLRNMILAPWIATIRWPLRRTMLWELCGREPWRYLSEAGWAASAELSRRIFERPLGP
jgi:hypothetical protein